MSILAKDLKLDDIKQQQCILSPFWSLQNHAVARLHFLHGLWRRILSHLFWLL